MKITGELLKSERLKKNISVQDAAFSLKLSPRILNAIEDGNLKILPAKTFIRGFVKSYAEYLKLDADMVLRQFQEEMGSTQPLPKTPPPQPADVIQRRLSKTDEKEKADKSEMLNNNSKNKTLLYTGIAVVILILTIAINKAVDHYQKQKLAGLMPATETQVTNKTTSDTATNDITTGTTAATLESGASNTASANYVTSASTPTNSASTGTSNASATSSISTTTEKPNIATPEAAKNPVATSSAKPNEGASVKASVIEENFEPTPEKPVEIIVEARKEIEFFYAKGNTKNFTSIKLKPKQIQVIRSPSGLHIKTDDGSAIILTVNGVERGTPSSTVRPFKASY